MISLPVPRPFGRTIPKLTTKEVTVPMKLWFAQEMLADDEKIHYFMQKTGLTNNTLRKYKWMLKNNKKFNKSEGRPRLIDEEEAMKVVQSITAAEASNESVHYDQMQATWQKAAESTVAKTGMHLHTKISKRTKNRYNKKYISAVNAQTKPAARLQAERDIKNAFSQIVMWKSTVEVVKKPCCIINYDATQFEFGPNKDNTKVAVPKDFERQKSKAVSTASGNKSKDLLFYIKYFCMAAASGHLCPYFVFVVADDRMDSEKCLVYPVKGLSNEESMSGYLCFCKTRGCNSEFFKWFNRTVIPQFVDYLIDSNDLSGEEPFFVNCDGEHVQIISYLEDAEMDQVLKAKNVIVGKVAASCTAIAQPLDAWNLFKATKSELKHLDPSSYEHQEALENRIQAAITSHDTAMGQTLNAYDRRRLLKGLLAIRYAICNQMKRSTISASFKEIGLKPDMDIDYSAILAKFSCQLTSPEYMNMICNLGPACEQFRKAGYLKDSEYESFFDAVKRRSLTEATTTARDEMAISRQRCVILNNSETLKRYQAVIEKEAADKAEKLAMKEEKKIRAQEKMAVAEQKKAEKEEKKRKRLEDDAAKATNPKKRGRPSTKSE